MTTEADRIRAAERTVTEARKTLKKAEAGLQAAERVGEDDGSHPVRKLSTLLTVAGIIAFAVKRFRKD